MRHVLTAGEMRAAEQIAVASGVTLQGLMECAGAALASEVARRSPEGRVVVATGGGNNGGDGWVAARLLHDAGRDVFVLALASPDTLPSPADVASRDAVHAGVAWSADASPAGLAHALSGAAIILDALLGIGARGAPRGSYADAIAAIRDAGVRVVAADVPSGVDADSGAVEGVALVAEATVTFAAMKPGLALLPGSAHAGKVVVADIGIPEAALAVEGALEVWSRSEYADILPRPRAADHKYSRGRLLIIGGAPGMTGAVCLAAAGALRMGAGYVAVAVPAASLQVVEMKLTVPVKLALPWNDPAAQGSGTVGVVLSAAERADAVVIGPGLGRDATAREVVLALVERTTVPLLLDADALFALGQDMEAIAARTAATVITPHAGEAARLLGIGSAAVGADRIGVARSLAPGGVTAVLKGPGTLIAGDGRLAMNRTGGPGLATLGTGDVLAGVIGALLAQGLAAFEAAALGAHVHGSAGDAASRALTPVCCTAEDVVAYLPEAIGPLYRGSPAPHTQEDRTWQN